MSFLLRAALVIGALSYLAAVRGQPGTRAAATDPIPMDAVADDARPQAAKGSMSLGVVGPMSAAWSALPAEARQRLAQEAAAELGRYIAPAGASRDTLGEADRRTAWRGTETR